MVRSLSMTIAVPGRRLGAWPILSFCRFLAHLLYPCRMKEMPAILSYIVEEHLAVLLLWCSRYLYERLLPHWQGDYLVQTAAHFDFTPIEAVCAPYHQGPGKGRGRPVAHTVPRMVRVLFLMYQANTSYRQTESRLRRDLLWRWFAGYPLFAAVPDHNTIFLFDQYVRSHHPRLYFDVFLRQIDAQVPAARQRGQIGDTFAVRANAALEGPTRRLRHLCSHLLSLLDKHHPEAYEWVITQVETAFDEGRLFGWDEQVEWSDPEKRQARRQETVLEALACRALVRPFEATLPPLQAAAALIDKMIADEFSLTWDEQQRLEQAVLLPAEKRGHLRICSATDPEATFRNHGDGKKDFGFNGAVAASDTGLIREIAAHTGSVADVATIPPLLTAQKEHHDLQPATFSFDQIAGTGKTAADVHHASGGQTRLIAKPMPSNKKDGTFTARDCSLSADGLCLTCPGDRITYKRYETPHGDGWTFRLSPAQCLGCPLLVTCRGTDKQPTTPRNFFVSRHMAFLLALLRYSRTKAFAADMKKRPRIELVIAHLVLFHGARQARFRGTAKVDYQLKMAAMAYNVKWYLNRRRRQGQHRTTPAATLSPATLPPAPGICPRETYAC